MPARQSAREVGAARSRFLRQRLSADLTAARLAAGLSVREVALRIGVSDHRVTRLERGEPGSMTVDLVARQAATLGIELAASLHLVGDPVRDRAHLALIRRFRRRTAPSLRWRVEAPIPIAGDRRSADGLLEGKGWDAIVEAETRLSDIQLVERRAAAKQRDLAAKWLILLVADTRHNRDVIRRHPELRERFPIDTRTCLRRLADGMDPGGDCLVVL